jgi:hypothetical protein
MVVGVGVDATLPEAALPDAAGLLVNSPLWACGGAW